MSLSSKDIWNIVFMRMAGRTWKEIKEEIPTKNVYSKFTRLALYVNRVSSKKYVCTECGHIHKKKRGTSKKRLHSQKPKEIVNDTKSSKKTLEG